MLNQTIQALFGGSEFSEPGTWLTTYAQVWASVTRNRMCGPADIGLLQSWAAAILQQDLTTAQLKEQNFWEGFGFLQNQNITWAQGPGAGYEALITFDKIVVRQFTQSK